MKFLGLDDAAVSETKGPPQEPGNVAVISQGLR